MDFNFDAEQEALREAVQGLLGDAYSDSEARRTVTRQDPGFSEQTWRQLAEMGLLGLPFAEADAGMGAGPVEVSIVAEEFGRVIAPEPFVESVILAGGLVAATGNDKQRADVLGQLSEGSIVLAFAHATPNSRWSLDVTGVQASPRDEGWVLNGAKEPVLHGGRADMFVVSASTTEGPRLFLVDGEASGLSRTAYSTHDGGRAARLVFVDTPAELLSADVDHTAAIAQVVAEAQVAYCHEAVGAMDTALKSTASYLTTRKQFGVTLNKFQALNFRAADMYVSLELARSVTAWATLVLADAPERAQEAAARAKAQVSKAARHIGQEAIQLHGGIGMTAEYSVGHYMSRLTAIDHTLGDGAAHLKNLASDISSYGVLDPLA